LYTLQLVDFFFSQVLTSASKWNFFVNAKGSIDVDAVAKRALDSIPDDVLPTITETTLESMLLAPAFGEGMIAIIALSNRNEPSALIRNAAVSSKGFARMGFYPNPSAQFLAGLGNIKLPAVIALVEGLADLNGQKQFQVLRGDMRHTSRILLHRDGEIICHI
jgi:hypothetical protein